MPPYCMPTIPPWVYPPSHLCTVYHDQGVQCVPLPEEEALGSEERLITKKEASLRLRTLEVLLFLGSDAQSYSFSQGITTERLDSDRVNLPLIPYGRPVCAEWCALPAIRSLLVSCRADTSVRHQIINFSPECGGLGGPVTGVGSLCVRWRNLCADTSPRITLR